ncbi:MAG: ribosomal-processing cysteine protease Prp [Lawsonibacter sp.]|nr:ribosomal-processing cysteine protease Prp [Lawsonibacter sp.]
MTRIYAEAEGGRYLLNLDGHATGSPEVCAAVSGLVYALAGYVTNAERDGFATVYHMETESGKAVLHCHGDRRVEAAYDMAIIGLQQIEKQYPQLVKVEFSAE